MIDRSKIANSLAFMVTAGARTRQLLAGSTPRVADGGRKKVTVARQEVLTRQVKSIERAGPMGSPARQPRWGPPTVDPDTRSGRRTETSHSC
jgi:DNA-directed RNA polymerase subunit K/omega